MDLIQYPKNDIFSFDNQLVAVMSNGKSTEFNFVFSNGEMANVKSRDSLKQIKIQPAGCQIKKILLWYSAGFLSGLQLFSSDDKKLLESGITSYNDVPEFNKPHIKV